jgi:hypothetical protein
MLFDEKIRPTGTDKAKIVTLIVTESKRGLGTSADKHRIVREYWSLNGDKVAEYDPVRDDIGLPTSKQADG